jgi:hypothetical protein
LCDGALKQFILRELFSFELCLADFLDKAELFRILEELDGENMSLWTWYWNEFDGKL